MNLFAILAAVVVGGAIGVCFGLIQDAARRRYEKRQQEGKLGSAGPVMMGSGARVAYLLLALLAVQIICPIIFRDGIQWWVSGSLVFGYGVVLARELRKRIASGR